MSGPLTWPRFRRLVERLPRESWTMREIVGDAVRWGEQEHLLATLIDVQAIGNWMYASAHSKRAPDMPKPLRRPGTPDPTRRIGGKRSYTPEEFDRLRATMTPKAVS